MIISSWNIRGFNKPLKHLEVIYFLKNSHIDILGLLETRVRKHKASKILKNKFGRYKSFTNYNSHSNGRIWLLWNPITTSISILEEQAQVVHCKVTHLISGRTFLLSVVYGFNNAGPRHHLWQSLSSFANLGGPWVTMGDFNVVRHFHEKISSTPPVLSELNDFNSCLLTCGLDDLPGTGAEFTWFNKHDASSRVYSKLDRVLVNSEWIQCFTQNLAKFEPPGGLDHCPALLTFHDDPLPPKRFIFRIFGLPILTLFPLFLKLGLGLFLVTLCLD
ncbi:uncharacterized protein LOC141649216 [Silene latifolia]|uniref:uncharacterized protein LOC141649216 n=1 Tax=Silene latifolia TaxID=37657 RepID=UPI003D78B02E